MALIENSSRCPTNEEGEKVVPGEVPWIVDLVDKVSSGGGEWIAQWLWLSCEHVSSGGGEWIAQWLWLSCEHVSSGGGEWVHSGCGWAAGVAVAAEAEAGAAAERAGG